MREVLLGLTLAEHVGWKTIQRCILHGIDECCFNLSPERWGMEFPFLSSAQIRSLGQWMHKERLLEYEDKMKKKGMVYVTALEEAYPSWLKEIDTPPWLLFAKGDLALLDQPSLSIVGSRKTTAYGRAVTEKLTSALAQHGWVIASGLALGTDANAHQATLNAQGKTIAVLGCGIDQVYPPQNRHLYTQVEQKGLLLSEYAPGTKAHPAFFPLRNRIIAGLSRGTIVIEAAKKSGSLITAHRALEYGREIFAIPGSIFDAQSVGTNLLIQQQGAKLVTHVHDVLDELNEHPLPLPQEKKTGVGLNRDDKVDDQEQMIVELLKREKMHMNELRSQTALSFAELSKILLNLELKQRIQALPGSYYQIKDRIE